MQVYEVRPRKDHRGVNLISDALPFARLWYGVAGNVIETHEHAGEFKRRWLFWLLGRIDEPTQVVRASHRSRTELALSNRLRTATLLPCNSAVVIQCVQAEERTEFCVSSAQAAA